MTDPSRSDAADRIARIDRLRQRRSEPGPALTASPTTPPAAAVDRPPAASQRVSPASSATPRRRRHPAFGGRIAAAGLGATSMFTIVTALGLDHAGSGATGSGASESVSPAGATPIPAAPTPAPPTPIKVIIHRAAIVEPVGQVDARTDPTASTDAASTDAASVVDPSSTGPIELTANPVVRTVTVVEPSAPSSRSATSQSAPAAPAPQAAPAATTSGSK